MTPTGISYVAMKNLLDARTAVRGVCDDPSVCTAGDLVSWLIDQGVLKGKPGWYRVSSSRRGLFEYPHEPILPWEEYAVAPGTHGIGVIIGAVLAVATIGYSIYQYVNMKNQIDNVQQQLQGEDSAEPSQAYALDLKGNRRRDNLPIPGRRA